MMLSQEKIQGVEYSKGMVAANSTLLPTLSRGVQLRKNRLSRKKRKDQSKGAGQKGIRQTQAQEKGREKGCS